MLKRHVIAGLSILAVVVGMGWRLASHPEEASAGLHDVGLVENSEHSHPGSTKALAGIRIRLSPNDFDVRSTAHEAPEVAVAAE
jgi:hypothetical protein